MSTVMQEPTTTSSLDRFNVNPPWLTTRMPKWASVQRATKILHRSDDKALSDRCKAMGVPMRIHPFDRRKRIVHMPTLLEMLDYDITRITFFETMLSQQNQHLKEVPTQTADERMGNQLINNTAIASLLKAHPDWSDTRLAQQCHVSPPTIGKTRKRLAEAGEIPLITCRVGLDGKRIEITNLGRQKQSESPSVPSPMSMPHLTVIDGE